MISTSTKKRAVFGFVLFLGLWPIFHHWLVTRYEMDPWKYFGMSMYAKTRPMVNLASMEMAYPGELFQELPFRSPEDRFAVTLLEKTLELVARRKNYGTLYRPEVIVREMFQILPSEIDRLTFTMGLLSLDSKAMLTLRVVRTECKKEMDRSGVECKVV